MVDGMKVEAQGDSTTHLLPQLVLWNWHDTPVTNAYKYMWAAAQQNQQNDLCAQQSLRSAWASVQFDQSMKKPRVLSYPLRTQWRLIRLGGCPGWSEFAGCTCHFVGFVMRRLISFYNIWATFQDLIICRHNNISVYIMVEFCLGQVKSAPQPTEFKLTIAYKTMCLLYR